MRKINITFLFLLLFVFNACIEESDYVGEFTFTNQSGLDLKLTGTQLNEPINLLNNQSYTLKVSGIGGYGFPFPDNKMDTAILIFSDKKQLIYHGRNENEINNICIIKNYKRIDINKHYQKYEYTVSKEDYERAK